MNHFALIDTWINIDMILEKISLFLGKKNWNYMHPTQALVYVISNDVLKSVQF